MDALKNFANKGSSSSNNNNAQAGGAQDDYLDKAVASGEKKYGYSQSRETNEKITDGARDMFEKATGKQVPEKFSN